MVIFSGNSLTDEITIQPLPHGLWFIESDKGWTSNEISIRWLKQIFEPSTHRSTGVYRLLIVDGHRSHLTAEFDQYCEEKKILALCMPAHSSHL